MKIQIKLFSAALMAAAVLMTGTTASAAAVLQGSVIKLTNPGFPNGAGSNGEFSADIGVRTNSPTLPATYTYDGIVDFYTYCVEVGQHFNPGGVYDVVKLDKVTSGDGSPVYPQRTLTKSVAWLFREFTKVRLGIAGNLGSAFYNTSNATAFNSDANQLQEAIWYYMSPSESGISGSNKYIGYLTANATQVNNLSVDATSIGGVQVLQLRSGGKWQIETSPGVWVDSQPGVGTYRGGGPNQDQLYVDINSLVTNPVPEPASVFMWLTVAVGGAFARRRVKNLAC